MIASFYAHSAYLIPTYNYHIPSTCMYIHAHIVLRSCTIMTCDATAIDHCIQLLTTGRMSSDL